MARPKNKAQLLEQSQKNVEKLFAYVDSLSPEQSRKEFPKGTLNRNVRDVIAHLYHWHTLLQGWYHTGLHGEKPDIPAKGYTWKTTPELNRAIQQQHSDMPLEEAMEKLTESHSEMMDLIQQHSDDELFEKRRYPWTGSTSLGAYLISATASHYDWALKLIKKALK